MTGLGKYQKGLELEAEGMSAYQIAEKLGYKNTQAWHAAKSYYSKKQEAFNARAAGKPAKMPEELPKEKKEASELPPLESESVPEEWMKDGKQLKRVPRLKQKPQFPPVVLPEEKKPEPKLVALKQDRINYRGKVGRYDVSDQWVTIYLPFEVRGSSADLVFDVGLERAKALAEEFRDLLNILEVNK